MRLFRAGRLDRRRRRAFPVRSRVLKPGEGHERTWNRGNLIGSDKVEGTDVYGANNEAIGSIQRVMIDKRSGQVSYAVLGFGGFLADGEKIFILFRELADL